jgi:hypothetical protein
MKINKKINHLFLCFISLYAASLKSNALPMTCILPGQGRNETTTYKFTIDENPAKPKISEQIIVGSSILRKDLTPITDSVERSPVDNHLTRITGYYKEQDGSNYNSRWKLQEIKAGIWSADFAGFKADYTCSN